MESDVELASLILFWYMVTQIDWCFAADLTKHGRHFFLVMECIAWLTFWTGNVVFHSWCRKPIDMINNFYSKITTLLFVLCIFQIWSMCEITLIHGESLVQYGRIDGEYEILNYKINGCRFKKSTCNSYFSLTHKLRI